MYTPTCRPYAVRRTKRITRAYIKARQRIICSVISLLVLAFVTLCAAVITLSASVGPASALNAETMHNADTANDVLIGIPTTTETQTEEIIPAEEVPLQQTEEPVIETEEPVIMTDEEILAECLGDATIEIGSSVLTRQEIPNMDISTFQPYEDYRSITNTRSAAYRVTFSEGAYTDDNGLRRVPVPEGEFSINGEDDYVVAMGTYYKEKGVCGIRFLIVTDVGSYTVTTGDEKADAHTGDLHMYTLHGNENQYAGILEWIVDIHKLPNMAARMGSIHYVPFAPLNGTIQMIYRIG